MPSRVRAGATRPFAFTFRARYESPNLQDAVADLAETVRTTGADDLAYRLEVALEDDVKLLALTIDERAVILDTLDDPPQGLE